MDYRQPHFLLYQNNGKLAFQVDIIFTFHGDIFSDVGYCCAVAYRPCALPCCAEDKCSGWSCPFRRCQLARASSRQSSTGSDTRKDEVKNLNQITSIPCQTRQGWEICERMWWKEDGWWYDYPTMYSMYNRLSTNTISERKVYLQTLEDIHWEGGIVITREAITPEGDLQRQQISLARGKKRRHDGINQGHSRWGESRGEWGNNTVVLKSGGYQQCPRG